jgi:hypothetical protein
MKGVIHLWCLRSKHSKLSLLSFENADWQAACHKAGVSAADLQLWHTHDAAPTPMGDKCWKTDATSSKGSIA